MRRLAALIPFAVIVLPCAAADLVGQATVIDGDSIEIRGHRVLLFGVNAPESGQTCKYADGTAWDCGQQVAHALAEFLGQRIVSCEYRDLGEDDRRACICHVEDQDVGQWLVKEGWAFAERQQSLAYVEQEQAAQSAGRGIWRGESAAP